MPEAGDLLTVAEVVARTRASENTVRRWLRNGTLPVVRIGHRVLVPAMAIDEKVDAALAEWREAAS